MREKERALRLRLKNDFLHYAEKCLKIRTKRGGITPLRLNAAQLYIHTALERQLEKTGRVRALILKGRQQGCSTYVEARFFWRVTHRTGVRAFILTHLEEATRNVYKIVQRFHEHCPPALRPHCSHANARELTFDRLDSGYRIGTANSAGTGRSDTLQYFHGSEAAYWAKPEEHMAGVLQAVADEPDTEIILESTSDGPSGLFYTLCRDAHAGLGEYILIFVPWFWQDEYRKTPPQDFQITPEEEALAAVFKLDPGQLYWRRTKIHELGGAFSFRREYPATVEEAFQSDRPGALWRRRTIDANRVPTTALPEFERIVVAIDPATTSTSASDATGIIVAARGIDGHAYVLDDLSGVYTPAQWARIAISAFEKHNADRIIAETNQGGDMVEHTLRTQDPEIPFKKVHACRGKRTRAEPIAALDEQGRIHHAGFFAALEDEMCRFENNGAGRSPDRVDARVWALTELMLEKKSAGPMLWQG